MTALVLVTLLDEMTVRACRAVEDNARHSHCSLFELLAKEFPEATDEDIEEAADRAL